MRRQWILIAAIYVGMAVIVGVTLGSVNLLRFARLKNQGRAAQGTVSRTDCGNHATVVSTFEVLGATYEARGPSGYQNPECRDLKTGDKVLVYYLPVDPAVNVLGDVREQWKNEVTTIIGAMFVLPLIPVAALLWRNRRRFARTA